MVRPNKSVKRPLTVDLHLESLLHDAMEAKFWISANRGLANMVRTKLTCMTFLCMNALRNKTIAHTFLQSIDDANGFLCQERLLKFRHFATMVRGSHTFPLY